jgi:hypothetical protein
MKHVMFITHRGRVYLVTSEAELVRFCEFARLAGLRPAA